MEIQIESASKAFLVNPSNEELDQLDKQLSYTNTAAQHQVKRHYNNHWFRNQNVDAWEKQLSVLKEDVHNTLIFEEDGNKYIRPGSLPYLKKLDLQIENKVTYPVPKKIAWLNPIPFTLHPYQDESVEKLIEIRHGNVQLCTGSGKSAILIKICRETGFRTAIVAPSKSIFEELLEKFEYHFGRGKVGTFGDGKKKLGKLFTICISDSLANIKPDTEEWEFFSKLDLLAVDESHTWAAETLETVCHGVMANVPYRMFFSGTQTRNDGTAKLLQSIIGPTVCTLTTKEAREKGYICDHDYKIVEVESSDPNFATPDAINMKRIHFLRNRNICEFIAKLASAEARVYRRQTLVLVEELSQVASLFHKLQAAGIPTAIAHSEKNIKKLGPLGIEKVKHKESVEKFNKNEVKVLIGTSCISTGTNIYSMHNTINWQGGSSEIKTKQGAIGRSVRLGSQNPWAHLCEPKIKATIWDFNVRDIYIMTEHLKDRIGYYKESGSNIQYIRIKK